MGNVSSCEGPYMRERQPIAGALIVLAGALIIGLSSSDIPAKELPTITSLGLIAVGLYLVFRGKKRNGRGGV